MSHELDRMWQLRELDEEALVARARLTKLPEQKQSLESRVAAERARLAVHQKHAADLQVARRALEHEIEAVTAQQRQFESRQPSVKTNDEYRALTHEIDGCKSKRSDLETRVLQKYEEEEALNGQRPAIEKALKAAEAELESRRAEIDREEAAERERLAGLDAARAEQLSGLPANTRMRYERIHSSREGRAIVPILKGACGGCYRQQPPQTLQEARKRERMLICDGCGRMLVWPPDAP